MKTLIVKIFTVPFWPNRITPILLIIQPTNEGKIKETINVNVEVNYGTAVEEDVPNNILNLIGVGLVKGSLKVFFFSFFQGQLENYRTQRKNTLNYPT